MPAGYDRIVLGRGISSEASEHRKLSSDMGPGRSTILTSFRKLNVRDRSERWMEMLQVFNGHNGVVTQISQSQPSSL
jgi:hypothetical protein